MGETGSQIRAISPKPAPTAAIEEPARSAGSPVWALLIFVLVVFIGGALLAPWVYWLVQSLAPGSHLASAPFHRYLDRALLLFALLGMWPLLKSLSAGSPLNLLRSNGNGTGWRFARGFLLGIASLAFVAIVTLLAGSQHFQSDPSIASYLKKYLGAVGTAVAVPLLEETLFRGAVFGALRRAWDWRLALVASAMVYAIVHFHLKAELPGKVTWYSGLELLPPMLKHFTDWSQIIPGFLNLTLAGIILGFAYHRTRDLYFSMGMHAGWVLWLKVYGTVSSTTPGAAQAFWGTSKVIDGWLALLILAGLLVLMPRLVPERGGKLPE